MGKEVLFKRTITPAYFIRFSKKMAFKNMRELFERRDYMHNATKRVPIARCPNPNCRRTLLFSCDPRDKLHVTTKIADESYQGKMMICSRCKTIVAIIEKPKVTHGYVAIPITGTAQC